jgi:transposase
MLAVEVDVEIMLRSGLELRCEIFPGVLKRRFWSRAEKLRILALAQTSKLAAWQICEANGISINTFFRWRRQYERGELTGGIRVPVRPVPLPAAGSAAALPASRLAEIEIPGGIKLRFGEDIEPDALRRLLSALR